MNGQRPGPNGQDLDREVNIQGVPVLPHVLLEQLAQAF